jgi:SAM-dependent methyltransferase
VPSWTSAVSSGTRGQVLSQGVWHTHLGSPLLWNVGPDRVRDPIYVRHSACSTPRTMAWTVTERYNPSEYWERLHARDGLDAVGQSGIPANFNRWLYSVMARRLDQFVRRHDLRPNDVLDTGSGTGYWVAWWAGHGAEKVDGCDLVPVAVDRLRDRFPGNFAVLDIGTSAPSGTYDMVGVLNVLLHVTDDSRFQEALRNFAKAVRPGGLPPYGRTDTEWQRIPSDLPWRGQFPCSSGAGLHGTVDRCGPRVRCA